MNTIDIILAIILLFGLIRGFFRGFIAELASLVAFIIGIYVAISYSYILGDYLKDHVSWSMEFIHLIAFGITFILIVFLISLVGKFITGLINFVALGIINKLAGAAFGFLKFAFIISVGIMFFGKTNHEIGIVEQETIENSLLIPPLEGIAPMVLPKLIQEAKERNILKEDFEA